MTGPPHLESLALYLRAYRATAGVTYEEMSQYVDASPATLKRTAAGAKVPRWDRVAQFQDAIREINDVALYKVDEALPGPPDSHRVREALHTLWTYARREERGTLDVKKVAPETVGNPAELRYALWALYETAGAPPLRTIQARGSGELILPLSSLARIVSQEAIPADDQQLIALLNGVGRRETSPTWHGRWTKARARAISPREASRMLQHAPDADRDRDVLSFRRVSRARMNGEIRLGPTRTG
ncbi:XRE family transcriptional regulator [Streptomyces globisporus]|uniref:XRE family transcriptional regulator n=1 Tax=Streptomyces globisporus TaxID=1908 RepID=A0A423UQ46_STRGL|nr:XRE family transcriptional regulator [Streptomyces globisporus]